MRYVLKLNDDNGKGSLIKNVAEKLLESVIVANRRGKSTDLQCLYSIVFEFE